MHVESIGSPGLWAAFLAFVVAMLALDLGVFHRHSHRVTVKEAAGWSLAWVVLALAFAAGLGARFGHDRALEFTAGWLIEKALAVDNIFVFVVIFRAFAIPEVLQHRVLFWGVFGALVLRAGFVLAGDWIDTGLPATIESAAVSGHRAARMAANLSEPS